MPYTVQTKDGIVVRNIPDDIPADDPRVKAKVEAARASRATGQAPEVSAPVDPAMAKQQGKIEEPSFGDRFRYAKATATDLAENLQAYVNVGILGGAQENPVDDMDWITPDEYLEAGVDYTIKEKMQKYEAYRRSLIDASFPDVVAYNNLKAEQQEQQKEDSRGIVDSILEADYANLVGSAIGATAPEELAITALKVPSMMASGGLLGGATEGSRQLAAGEEADVGKVAIAGAVGAVAPLALKGAGTVAVAASKPIKTTSQKIARELGTNVKPRVQALKNKVEAKLRNKPISAIEYRQAANKVGKIEDDTARIMVKEKVDGPTAMDKALKKNGVDAEGVLTLQDRVGRGLEVPTPEQAVVRDRFLKTKRGRVGEARDYLIRPIAAAIKEIDEGIFGSMKWAELQKLKLSAQAFDIVGVFATRMKDLSTEDASDLSAALFNRNLPAAIEIAKKANNGLEQSLGNVRKLLDDLHENMKDAGVDVRYLEDYFPRYVTDLAGLRNALGSKGTSRLNSLLDAEAKKKGLAGRDLLDEEDVSSVLVKYFRDTAPESVGKMRAERLVTEGQSRDFFANFYEEPTEALARYVTKSIDEITKRRFFGDSYTVEGNLFDIDASLTKYVANKLKREELSELEVADLKLQLKLVFDTPQTGTIANGVKDLSYLATLGQLSSSLIQLGDVGTVAFLSGMRPTINAMIQKFTGKSAYKVSDIGLYNVIQADIVKGGLGKYLDKTFRATGFAQLDRFGKEVAMNAAVNKWNKAVQSKKGIEEFTKKWGGVFGDDLNTVISQLRTGNRSDLTEYLAFLELSRIQPVTKSEMPQAYLNHPQGRILYTLKSYALKQLNLLREEIYDDFKKGKIVSGIKKSLYHAATVGLGNASVQSARDMLLGKDVDSGTFGDEFANTYATLMFMSRYDRDRYLGRGDFSGFVGNQLTPPILDIGLQGGLAAYKAATVDGTGIDSSPEDKQKAIDKFAKTVFTKIPVVGELGYYRAGGGDEAYNEALRKKRQAELNKALGY